MTLPNSDQWLVGLILLGALAGFVWGKWRYDVVALTALLAGVICGVVPADRAFSGFGHPAVITVAVVLALSAALAQSGAIKPITELIAKVSTHSLFVHIATLTAVGAALSAFMNNVGALALMMPVALRSALDADRSPALVLMPLSFGAILGGLTTVIGTPPNIIVAEYREEAGLGEPFLMFDFTPVGAAVAVTGIIYITLLGWRLVPKARREKPKNPQERFKLESYLTEAIVPKGSDLEGKTFAEVDALIYEEESILLGVVRGKRRIPATSRYRRINEGDVLVLEAGPDAIAALARNLKVDLLRPDKRHDELMRAEDAAIAELVVAPGSRLEGRALNRLYILKRYNINLLAVSRQGKSYRGRLRTFNFRAGDVLLIQGNRESVDEVVDAMELWPLAERGIRVTGERGPLAAAIFVASVVAAAFELVSLPIAFTLGLMGMLAARVLSPREVYEHVQWPVVVLLAAMIPLGDALETTGATRAVAEAIAGASGELTPVFLIMILMAVAMTLSDVMNNAATAVIMAPLAATLASQLNLSPDPFLMAVAIGSSCAFLTPIGHQNNMLIMGPGGYRFSDYWRMGLPLEILIVAIASPMLIWVWPL